MSPRGQLIVLAAGLGTRLWPLTGDRAKPAVPFLGKPLVQWGLELAARHGFTSAVVNTHYLPESIHDAIRGVQGLEVKLSHEPEILGTAGALARALQAGLLDPALPTLILNGKLYAELDLTAALARHHETGAEVTMVLRPNPSRERFREVRVEDGWVTGFGATDQPEPRDGPPPLLFTGLHVVSPAVLASIPKTGFSDTVKDLYPPLIAARRVAAQLDDRGRWWELSTLERYLDLHLRAAAEGLGPEVVLGPGAVIAPGAQVTRSVLWEGAVVPAGARLDEVVLGAGVALEPGTTLKRTVVVRRDRCGTVERGEIHGDLVHVPLTVA